MKISLFFLFVCAAQLLATNSNAQNAVINVNSNTISIKELINEIERQTDYLVVYSGREVNTEGKVNVNHKSGKVSSILEEAFNGSDVQYEFENNYIVLSKKGVLKQNQSPQQSERKVTGVIRDESGEPVIGASVVIKGTTKGTVSDVDGRYSIAVSGNNDVLIFTYLGYATREFAVGNQTVMDVLLDEMSQALDEVVVIGYGTVKRANLGGAVATADSKVFESRPVQNAASALQGEMPGLTVIRTSGDMGKDPVLRVRDVSSINGGSPLILIDGAVGNINLINPSDIENISVLKDGTAAIYGARAADGVILITTKNAKRNQKLKITLDAYYGIKTPALLKKPANLYEHAAMGLEITDGSFPIEYTQDELQLIAAGSDKILPASSWGRWTGYPKFYKDQDYNDMVIGNGSLQNYNVSLSGGGEKYSYLISLGYQRETGLPKFGVDDDNRYFVRSKSNIQIVKNLEYDINLSYEASNREYSSGISEGQNIWELIYKTRSWAPLRNPAGNFYTFEGFDNPAQVLEEGGVSTNLKANFTFNNQLKWQIADGLNLIGRAVVSKRDEDKDIIQKLLYSYNWDNVNHRTARPPSSAERNYAKTISKNFTLYGEYKKTFGKHDVGVMLGAANESEDYDKFWAKRINYDQQELMPLGLGSAENQTASSEGWGWTINSYFTRLNYAFAGKYLLEATLRADGSSRFDPDSRWGYFPGVNVAWRLGEESFMKKLNIFDDLKLRASYGEMGNQSLIDYYDYISLIDQVRNSDTKLVIYYPFGEGQKGQMFEPKNLVSTSRTWETIVSTNVGTDFAVLDNRLYGSFDYFWKVNKNMLIPVTYPAMLGIGAPATNSGRLEIHGWEVALGWRDRIGEFNYSVRANVSDAQNKVVSRVGNSLIDADKVNKNIVGYPMDSYFGYEFDGIIQNEQELAEYKKRFPNGGIPGDLSVGDAKYKDLDNDGKFTVLGDGSEGAGDTKYLGNTNPRYSFGFNLSAEFKGFDLSAFIQGVGQRTMFFEGEASAPFYYSWFQSSEYWYGKTWTPERTDAQYPAITLKDKRFYNYKISTNTKHNVAYARLKNLQLGYTLPVKLTQNWKLEKVRVYFSGEDLCELYNGAPGGWDPENGGSFVDYPFARSFSFGLSVIY